MPKFAAHKLHSGSANGPLVKKREQALAIMESERRRAAEGKPEYQEAGRRMLNVVHSRRKA